jgi:hypothetical protein
MGTNAGVWVLQSFCGTGTAGPCSSHCSGCDKAGSAWKAAYQNYKDCDGTTHTITSTNANEVSWPGHCPLVSLNHCTTDSSSVAGIPIKSAGPHFGTTAVSGCLHGHSSPNYKIGCLNRSAMNFLGNSGYNKMWAYNYTTS